MSSKSTERKIIVLAVGSDGDINPMIAIAEKLQDEGHKVEFLASEYFEQRVQAARLKFFPLGDRSMYERALNEKDVWHPYLAFKAMWKILYESIPITYDVLRQRYQAGDLIVGTSLTFAARMLQEQSGAKLATVHLSPSIAISAYSPPVAPFGPLPSSLPLFFKQTYVNMLDRFLLDDTCRNDLNKFRQKLGLPSIKSVFTKWIHSPDLVIMAWPEWFAPPQPDWPANSYCTEFPVFDHGGDAEISAETKQFIQAGAPPVVFTAGSAMAQGKEHFECALQCVKNQILRAVFVCKFRDIVPSNLPANIHHSLYEPFDTLFPLASAIQHHGGIGTSVQALRSGRPQLIVPLAHDQFDNAVRLKQLHVADAAQKRDSALWRHKLVRLIGDPDTKSACVELQNRIASNQRPLESITKRILLLGEP
jgi:rhamnosyltransferase subunit B